MMSHYYTLIGYNYTQLPPPFPAITLFSPLSRSRPLWHYFLIGLMSKTEPHHHELKKTELAMNEVGVMLDSIDANRHVLRTKIVEGISYADYISRLKEINTHIKDSQAKLIAMETSLKNSKGASSATIRR